MRFSTKGVCARGIDVEVDESGVITSCRFDGGCNGNTQGVARLVTGRHIDEVIGLLSGIECGLKGTSCPDQLARALSEYKGAMQNA